MKPSHWLALASAVSACAIACGIHIFAKPNATTPTSPAAGRSKVTDAARDRDSFKPSASSRSTRNARPDYRSPDVSPQEAARSTARRVLVPSDAPTGSVLSESQWREKAAKVEMEANHELDRLVGLLDLDPVQQKQVFSALAQQSPHWLPGMQTGSSLRPDDSVLAGGKTAGNAKADQGQPVRNAGAAAAGATAGSSDGSAQPANVDLTAYLTAEQQQSLVEEEMDRQAWWAEILPQILAPTITDGNDAALLDSGNAVSTDPAPETKDFDGGGILLEE
jgi:hypothetical protein